MFWNRIAAAGAIAVAFIAIALYAPALVRDKKLTTEVFHEHHGNKLELPQGTASIRTVDLYPDRSTPRFAVEDHRDGTTTHYRYRADGTLESATVYGVASAAGQRPVRRESRMAADGRTYVLDVAYFPDGSVERSTALTSDTTTTRRYFHANGQLARDQVMSLEKRIWRLTSELAFSDDGKKTRVFAVTPGVSAVDTIYGANQEVAAIKTHDMKTQSYSELWFDAAGKNVRQVQQDYNGTTLTVKRPNGTVSEVYRWAGNIRDAYVVYIDVMDAAGRKRLHQTLLLSEGEHRLRSVEIYATDGRRTKMFLFRTTGIENGTVEIETRFSGKNYSEPHTMWHYRPDGTLETMRSYSGGSNLTAEKSYEESANMRVAVNEDWTRPRTISELPPQVIEYVPESH